MKAVWRSQTKYLFIKFFQCIHLYPKNLLNHSDDKLFKRTGSAMWNAWYKSKACWDMPRYQCVTTPQRSFEYSCCSVSLSLSLALVYFSLSPTFKCGLADVRRRDLYWVKCNHALLSYALCLFVFTDTYTSCFIWNAELWIIHNIIHSINTLSQLESRVRPDIRRLILSFSLLSTA